jgi:hypothetical protein
MTTTTLDNGPVLASDLPPVSLTPRFVDTVRARFTAARDRRAFERAVRYAGPDEHGDLLAQARRA